MNLLLHTCCGPCSVFPLTELKDKRVNVTCFFYNPNIHPFQEFKRRIRSAVLSANYFNVPIEVDRDYGLKKFLRQVVYHEDQRCFTCYDMRLKQVAERAARYNFDSFSTTLLYSRYQNHELLCNRAQYWASCFGVEFYYQDFRKGWQKGIDLSRELELYRQPYCGCIYSEQERYDKKLNKN